MAKRVRSQRIRCRPSGGDFQVGGWLQGKDTYLWIGDPKGNLLGFISGRKMYRLAKAMVRHFEAER